MICVCDTLSASLIASIVLLCCATFFFGLGEFADGKNYGILAIRLNLIGFILVLNSAIFAILASSYQVGKKTNFAQMNQFKHT